MFEDSLFASNSVSSPRRGWTALVSFFVQTLFIAVLIALPLLFTEALPLTHLTDYLTVPPTSAPPVAQEVVSRPTHPPESNMDQGHLLQPQQIPHNVIQVTDEHPPVGAFPTPTLAWMARPAQEIPATTSSPPCSTICIPHLLIQSWNDRRSRFLFRPASLKVYCFDR